MGTVKGFSDRIENWLAKIPGIRTYRDREHRRETDKKLREHLGANLSETQAQLKELLLVFTQQEKLDLLAEMDRLSSHIQQMADTIRFASYGYGGIFDLEKIREEELDKLYAFDLALMEDLDQIKAKAEEMDPESSSEVIRKKIKEAENLLDSLEKKFRRRSDFMNRSA